MQITQPSRYRCTQLQYKIAVISEAPSMILAQLCNNKVVQIHIIFHQKIVLFRNRIPIILLLCLLDPYLLVRKAHW